MKEHENCTCDYSEAGICSQCRGNEDMPDRMEEAVPHVILGGCYHTGLAYSLGYDANGELELCEKIFNNLNTGFDGGAMAALKKHREQFDPNRDVEQFIVALKPVHIILGREEGEDYELSDNAGCDACGTCDRMTGSVLCENCTEDDTCNDCRKRFENCCCDDDDKCNEECCSSCDEKYECMVDYITCGDCCNKIEECDCDEDEPRKSIIDHNLAETTDTFGPMNAFDRARWNKTQ